MLDWPPKVRPHAELTSEAIVEAANRMWMDSQHYASRPEGLLGCVHNHPWTVKEYRISARPYRDPHEHSLAKAK